MFEVGFSEILLIGIVALLVLGPEKLPGAARTVGGIVRRLRQQWSSLQGELERELHTDALRKSMQDPLGISGLDESAIKQQLDETFAELRQAVKHNSTQGEKTSTLSEGLSVQPNIANQSEMSVALNVSSIDDDNTLRAPDEPRRDGPETNIVLTSDNVADPVDDAIDAKSEGGKGRTA